MNRIHVNFIVFALAMLWLGHSISARNIPQQTPETNSVHLRDVQSIKDIRTFMAQHPNLHLTRLIKKERTNNLQTVKYTLGSRVSGKLVDTF